MGQYLLLFHGQTISNDKKQKRQKIEELNRVGCEISNSLLDGGNPTDAGLKVTLNDARPLKGSPVTSYWVIEASDKEEALELSRSAPLYKDENGEAELYEIITEGQL